MSAINCQLIARTVLLVCSFLILASCTGKNGAGQSSWVNGSGGGSSTSQVNRETNALYLAGHDQPILAVSRDFKYGGAEIVPSGKQQTKRHIFTGPNSSFVTVAVLFGSPEDIRQAVSDSSAKEWEFVVQQIKGPQWIKVSGSITPCCTNLLHSRYVFVPLKQTSPTGAIGDLAEMDSTEQGYILVISYAKALPDNLPAGSWQEKGILSETGDDSGLTFDRDTLPGLANQQLGAEQRRFLQQHLELAAQAYSLR